MPSKKRVIKLFVLEFIQWAAFATPVFVTGSEFGLSENYKSTASLYWLVVSVSIGYVAGATLLVWLPVKLLFQWYKKIDFYNDEWCQSTLLFAVLSAVPVIGMVMEGQRIDTVISGRQNNFQYSSIELLTIMLAVTGVMEKMKGYRLLASKLQYEQEQNEAVANANAEAGSGKITNTERYNIYGSVRAKTGTGRNMMPLTSKKKMIKGYLSWNDPRPVAFLEHLLSIYDIRLEMLLITKTDLPWMYGILPIGLIATFSLVLTKYSRYYHIITVLLLDLPFFFLRLSVLASSGHVDSVLFLLKNFLVVLSFVYFNVGTELIQMRSGGGGLDLAAGVADTDFEQQLHRNDNSLPLPTQFHHHSNDDDEFDFVDSHHHQMPEDLQHRHHKESIATISGVGSTSDTGDEIGILPAARNKPRKKLESDLYRKPSLANGQVINTTVSQHSYQEAIYDDVPLEVDDEDDQGLPSPPRSVIDASGDSYRLNPSDEVRTNVSGGTHAAVNELDRVVDGFISGSITDDENDSDAKL